MKNALLWSILFVCSYHAVVGQSFLNLDFEYTGYRDQPRKWVSEGEGKFTVSTDSRVSQNGSNCLLVQLQGAETYTFLSLPGNLVAGKKIEVSGYVRTQSGDSLTVLLAFKDPNSKPIVFPVELKLKDQWVSVYGTSSVPQSYRSDRLLVAVIAMGSGSLRLDNFSIKIDGQSIGTGAPDFKEPLASEISAINKGAIPVSDTEPRIPSLKNSIRDAKIFALGENSHGSASIFKLKNSLVKYLIQQEGFTVFALESPCVEADSINAYVLNNTSDPKRIFNHLVYPSWKNQELLDLIEWIRSYNTTARVKVQFRGIDMQDGTAALYRLKMFFNKHNGEELPIINGLDTLYRNAMSGRIQWKELEAPAKSIVDLLDKHKVADFPGVPERELVVIRKCALILWQSIRLKAGNGSRDAFLADNVEFLLKTSPKEARIIVSADNSHVTKSSGKMGDFLNQRFAEQYLNLGATFNSGTYSAYGDKQFYDVHPSYAGTYEYILSKCKYEDFLLDIRTSELKSIFASSAGFRSIGSRPQEMTQFAEMKLSDHFDIIAYLERSEYSRTE